MATIEPSSRGVKKEERSWRWPHGGFAEGQANHGLHRKYEQQCREEEECASLRIRPPPQSKKR
ncbi:hypothetical protein N7532_003300 [Penicillium argentinense]|uniref:Uncharacterized protein n=1 Tax=Penicillium argentinense TaxID=1131581 RepID=A0A9W9FM58_9EURO|nr:uncharacterized protein N7532_003300 [Penicillium argentinense]KAJ5102771.1 hypothetical protein N7532_003300 [Penicillium argentinense]